MGARRKPQSPTQEASNELQSAIGTAHGDELGKARGTGTEFQRASGTSGHGFLPVERSEILLGWADLRGKIHGVVQRDSLLSGASSCWGQRSDRESKGRARCKAVICWPAYKPNHNAARSRPL